MTPTFAVLYEQFNTTLLPQALQIVITISPVILTVFLAKVFFELWVDYVRSANFLKIKYTVLELNLPKETWKNPMAVEVFLTALHVAADGNLISQLWKGETRPWYSLEIISIEGKVKFMIWTEDRRKAAVISALYSQFPGIEVREVEDYTKSVHFDPTKIRIWAAEFKKTKDDPIPIRTYMEYGLDKDPKEEFKIDPLVPLLEFLGSVPPNSQIWIQILIRAHKKTKKKGHLFKTTDDWEEKATEIINTIMARDPKTKISGVKDPKTGKIVPAILNLTKGETEGAAAMERTIYKKAFDVGIRTLYIAKKDEFNTIFGVGGIIGNMGQFSAAGSNGLKTNGDKWHPSLDYPWQDFMDIRRNRFGKIGLMAYKRRSYFYTPFESKHFVMNTEELATIFHFPGQTAKTPTLDRIPSKKAQAPANLPI